MAAGKAEEVRDGVALTNLDQSLFEGAAATKRDLVDYLDGMADRMVPVLADRPLSVIRVHRGDAPFMQKNVPRYTPDWIQTVTYWAESSKRNVEYALCNDRRTLLWFANQRAVEFHPTLVRLEQGAEQITHLVLDLDPPEGAGFKAAVRAAHAVKATLDDLGLAGAAKTSGAKGLHVFVPLTAGTSVDDAAAATRAIAARATNADPSATTTAFLKEDRAGKVFIDATRAGAGTVVAAYSPRARPGTPVSTPFSWDDLDEVTPADFTLRTVLQRLGEADPWADDHPTDQTLPAGLVAEGKALPSGRVEAMHEGLRRSRAGKRPTGRVDQD